MQIREALEIIGEPLTPERWGELASAAKIDKAAGEIGYKLCKMHASTEGGEIAGFKLRSSGSTLYVDPKKARNLAGSSVERLHELLEHASFKTSAGDLEWLQESVSKQPKAMALVRTKRSKA